jgi:hypothetical protein
MTTTFVRRSRPAEAAAALRVTTATIWRWMLEGAPCDRLSRRTVLVSVQEMRQWLRDREAARTVGGRR